MLHRLSFRAMGSEMLAILDQDSEAEPPILNAIPAWFENWEQTFSRFRPTSELSRLNRTFDQPMKVSEAFWDVFQTALWADELSGGLVTPTILESMIEAGYDRPFERLSRDQFDVITSSSETDHPLSMVVSDSDSKTINLPMGVGLDFGGVAKGWAAHQAVERLQQHGPCLVNAGGDIAVSGPRMDGSPWPVGVSNPFNVGANLSVLQVKRGGIATSGKDRRNWNRNGVFHHHIINPLTGLPAETDLLRVTMVAPTAMQAEAAAKTAFILGREKGLEWIESQPEFAGLMVLETGDVLQSRRMEKYL